MEAMICKQETGFESVFFDANTIDDLLNVLDEYNYPPMEINIEDGENGDPRIGIELLDERCGSYDPQKEGIEWRLEDAIKYHEPKMWLSDINLTGALADSGFSIRDIKHRIGRRSELCHHWQAE